jgi:hypothetical protein
MSMNKAKVDKENLIRDQLRNGPCNVWELREMALTCGGFINGNFILPYIL